MNIFIILHIDRIFVPKLTSYFTGIQSHTPFILSKTQGSICKGTLLIGQVQDDRTYLGYEEFQVRDILFVHFQQAILGRKSAIAINSRRIKIIAGILLTFLSEFRGGYSLLKKSYILDSAYCEAREKCRPSQDSLLQEKSIHKSIFKISLFFKTSQNKHIKPPPNQMCT